MPTTTVAPTAFAQTGGAGSALSNVGGAASLLAAVSDASDTTLARIAPNFSLAGQSFYTCTFADPNLADGTAISSITIKARAAVSGTPGTTTIKAQTAEAKAAGTTVLSFPGTDTAVAGASMADYTLTTGGAYNGQAAGLLPADVDSIVSAMAWYVFPGSGTNNLDTAKLSADVAYVRAPTVTAQGVTGQTTTTRPVTAWTITDADSLGQYAHQAAVWLVADQANFPGGQAAMEANPDYLFGLKADGTQPSPPAGVSAIGSDAQGPYFTVSGTTYRARAWTKAAGTGLPGWKQTVTGSWTPDQDLPLAGAMKVYNRNQALYASNGLFPRAASAVAGTAFTMAVTPPNQATSLTAVWQYPGATAPDNTGDYRMKLTVALPSDSITRNVRVERQVAGTNKWALLPAGAYALSVSTSAQSLTFYDTGASPQRSMQYRVTTGRTNVEAWGTPVLSGSSPTATFDAFILRDPTLNTTPVVLRVQNDLEATSEEIVGFSRGLGASLPTSVSDAITGDTYPIEVVTLTEAEYQLLTALRARRTTLLLQGDMPGWYRWVRFGEDWNETIFRQSLRRTDAFRTRRLKFSLVETWPIFGQPLRADWGV